MRRGLPGTTFSQKTGSNRVTFWSRKKSQVKIKGSFCVLGGPVLPLVLFLSPVPPVLQPLVCFLMSPSLHCHQGQLQGAAHMPSPPDTAVISAPSHTSFPNWGCPEFPKDSPLLPGGSYQTQSATVRAEQISVSPPCLCSGLRHTIHTQAMESKHINQSWATKLVKWITPSFAELLFDAF